MCPGNLNCSFLTLNINFFFFCHCVKNFVVTHMFSNNNPMPLYILLIPRINLIRENLENVFRSVSSLTFHRRWSVNKCPEQVEKKSILGFFLCFILVGKHSRTNIVFWKKRDGNGVRVYECNRFLANDQSSRICQGIWERETYSSVFFKPFCLGTFYWFLY